MNTPADIHSDTLVARSEAQVDEYVHRHPGGALLIAAGIGIAVVLLARVMRPPPPPPRNRAVRLLEDIQQRLNHLSKQGGQALSQGADSVSELQLDRKFDKLSSSFKKLFHS